MNATTATPTPLGLARSMRKPLTSQHGAATARPPLAALVMRVAFDRVVLWTVCIDAGGEDMAVLTGRLDELERSGDQDAPGAVFALAAVQVLPEVAPALREAAQASEAGYVELAVPNASLRTIVQQVAAELGPAQVLPSNAIVRLPAVDRAVAQTDATYAEVLAGRTAQGIDDDRHKRGKKRTDVLVATDASMRRRRAPAGVAWVRGDGMFATQVVDTADIAVAELAAITMAVAAHGRHRGKLTIISDSRDALNMAKAALRGDVDAWSAAGRRYQRQLADSPIRDDVNLQWVKGHRGNLLNEAADELAVMARRHHDIGLAPSEHRVRAAAAVEEMLSKADDDAANG